MFFRMFPCVCKLWGVDRSGSRKITKEIEEKEEERRSGGGVGDKTEKLPIRPYLVFFSLAGLSFIEILKHHGVFWVKLGVSSVLSSIVGLFKSVLDIISVFWRYFLLCEIYIGVF